MTGTESPFRFVMEPRKRPSHQSILLYLLFPILGRRLAGADESIGWT